MDPRDQRFDDGTFLALPGPTWETIFAGAAALPSVTGDFACLVEVVVELENRHPVAVHRTVFSKVRAHADGRLDKDYEFEALRASLESMAFPLDDMPEGVVNASHRIAQRQREHMSAWKPTAAERRALAAAVNKRGGSRLL